MAAGASRVSLFIEGIDQFSDPLRKAREELRAFTKYYDQAGTKLKEVNRNMGRIEKIGTLNKSLNESKTALQEVTEKYKLMELAARKGTISQQKSVDVLRDLQAQRDKLNSTIERSEKVIDKETSALKEQGFQLDKLEEHYEELKKSKEELSRIKTTESNKVGHLREKEEAARFQKSLEKDKQEQKDKRKSQGLEYFATAGALGLASKQAFSLAREPVAQAMDLETGITDVLSKGLFEERRKRTPEELAAGKKDMTPEDLDKIRGDLRSQAMRLGSELPGYGAMDVVKLQQKAITQGMDISEVSDDFLKKILKFALIDKLDTGEAFDIVNSLRKSYKMPLSDTGRISDLIAYTSIKSSASTDEIGKSFKEVQGLSAAVNVAPENMASFAAILADKGNLKGERAGTQLKNIMTALIVQDNETAKQLTEMGLKFTDDKGNLQDPVEIIGKIANKTEGWGDANLSKLLVGLGNEEAITAFSTLIRTYRDPKERGQLTQIQDAAKSGKITGTVDDVVAGLTQGLSPAIEELTGNLENLKTAIGTPMLEPISEAIRKLNSGLETLTSWFAANPLAGKIAFWGLLGIGITLAAGAIGFFIAALSAIAPVALGVAGTVMAVTAEVLAVIGVIFTVFKVFGWILGKAWDLAKGFFNFLKPIVKAALGGYEVNKNLGVDANGRTFTKPLPSLTDQQVMQRFKDSEKEKKKDLFGAGEVNYNADITVNVNSDAKDPKAIGQAVRGETLGGFDQMQSDSNRRLFD